MINIDDETRLRYKFENLRSALISDLISQNMIIRKVLQSLRFSISVRKINRGVKARSFTKNCILIKNTVENRLE